MADTSSPIQEGGTPAAGSAIGDRLARALAHGDIALALGLVAILIVLILPMPRWLLDLCLAMSITFSVT